MINRLLLIVSLAMAGVSMGLCFWFKHSAPRIAYVRSPVVVARFAGMQEARQVYQQHVDRWVAGADTLDTQYGKTLDAYQRSYAKLTAREKETFEQQLGRQQSELARYQASTEQKAKAEEAKIMQGALNQINSFVKEYARQHGYNVVLGTTQEGSLLYADEAIDITEQIVEGLNRQHKKP